jgi:hypothetical protein
MRNEMVPVGAMAVTWALQQAVRRARGRVVPRLDGGGPQRGGHAPAVEAVAPRGRGGRGRRARRAFAAQASNGPRAPRAADVRAASPPTSAMTPAASARGRRRRRGQAEDSRSARGW